MPKAGDASPTAIPSSHGRGQTLALFALFMPAILALMALGLDGAQLFLGRRLAQGAADLAAISGARELPDDASAARAQAISIAVANGYEASQVVATTPYVGDETRIEVTIDSSVDTFFMPILELFVLGDRSTVAVGARAVAHVTEASGYGDALFAAEDDCAQPLTVLSWPANNVVINGGIHSNQTVVSP